jgi:FKBP-type peptidyl-prolyl cis-trans isomerase
VDAKISHSNATIGRRDDAGRRWLCPADSSSKHSGGDDSSGSCRHNSESGHHGEDSGEEDGNGGKKRGARSAYDASGKVQLRPGNEHWGQPQKAGVEADPALISQGYKDATSGGKTRLTQEEAQAVLNEVQTEVRKRMQEKMQQAAATNKTEGEAFLAANKDKEGVITLPSGLQYKILTAGTGPKPAPTDSVVCNYRGTLVNGTEFDSSYKRGQPTTFGVGQVIKGWTEALQLMPVGSKWQLFVPSGLAYGERGEPRGGIEPNETLIFEVELLSIQEKAKDDKSKDDTSKEDKSKDDKSDKPEEKKQ